MSPPQAALPAPLPPAPMAQGPSGPTRGRRFALWAAVVSAVGLLLFTYRHLEGVVAGGRRPWRAPLIEELTAALAGGLLFFAVAWLVRRWPLDAGRWRRHLPLYLAATLLFAAAHTTAMWGSRALLFPLAGLGAYDYGRMPLRYAMELPAQTLIFWIIIAALYGRSRLRAARRREVRTAQLEASLARAQLSNLRLQLQPHFLFNALNTISATMYDDPGAADEMIDRLAELLRASLRTAQTDEVPLATELEVLDAYLGILRARFGDRLTLRRQVDPEAGAALVPSLLLQPLVENAVRHGNAERSGRATITLGAERRGAELVLTVEDDGPGSPPGRDPLTAGLGLSATAERLRLLYGEGQRLTAANGPGGGFRVEVVLPFHRRGEAAA